MTNIAELLILGFQTLHMRICCTTTVPSFLIAYPILFYVFQYVRITQMSATTFGPSKFQNSFVSNLMGMTFFRIVTICKFKGARKNLSILEKLLHVTVHMFLHAKTFIIWNISYFLIFSRLKILFFRLSPNPMCTKQGTSRISLIFFSVSREKHRSICSYSYEKTLYDKRPCDAYARTVTKKICGNWKLRRISNQILHKCNKRSHTTQCTGVQGAQCCFQPRKDVFYCS